MQHNTSRSTRLASFAAVALAASDASAALSIDANGSFFQLEGTTNTVANITMALTPSSGTAYGNFIGGTLNVTDTTIVGQAGTAVFDHKGGTFNSNRLIISNSATANGAYRMTTGNVNVTHLEIAKSAAAELVVSGGTFRATNITNAALGNVLVRGGTLHVPSNLVINSGRIAASNNAGVFFFGGLSGPGAGTHAATAGELILHAGSQTGLKYIRQRTLRMPDPSPNASIVPSLTLSSRLFGGQTSIVKELIIHKDNAGVPRGRIELADSALVIDYDGAASPISDIRNLLVHGRNNGAWNGLGITSGDASLNPSRFALGYAEANKVLGASGGTFTGLTVDGTSVLVRFTVMGDANLDGQVGFPDLLAVAANFGAGNAHWSDGDFDYNNSVNFNDLLVVASKFGGALPSFVPGAAPEFNVALAQVPEPGAAALGMAALALRRRRRKD